ncbi:PPE domain-containing protein, partial [Nocardia neocaledoniensis]
MVVSPLEAVSTTVATIGTATIFNQIESHDAATERGKLVDQGKQQWEGDRGIISDEWARLSNGAALTRAKTAIEKPEAFSSWTHQQIWDALNAGADGAVDADQVNAGADGWRRLTTGLETAVTTYRSKFDAVVAEKWSGQSGNAAIEAIRTYTTEATQLSTSFQMVANGIDWMQGLLGQAKITIPEPEDLSLADDWLSHMPGNGVLKMASHRANEAEASAQLFMIGTYQPGATTVDGQTPVLPTPKNGMTDPGGDGNPNNGDNTNNGGGNPNTNNPSTDPAATQQNPATTDQPTNTDDTTEDDSTDDDTTDDDTDTTPTTTDDGSTAPASTADPTGSKLGDGTPGTGSPGGGSPGGGSGGGSPGGGAAGVPGAGT